MSQADLLKPKLYAAEGTSAVPDHPSLNGGRCECGYVFFPMQTYGCEVCGRTGDALKPVKLSGRGRLNASSTVHIHAAGGRGGATNPDVKPHEAPFTIGSITLEDGPTVRTLLVNVDEKTLKHGQAMVTTLVPVGAAGKSILDLRFTPAS